MFRTTINDRVLGSIRAHVVFLDASILHAMGIPTLSMKEHSDMQPSTCSPREILPFHSADPYTCFLQTVSLFPSFPCPASNNTKSYAERRKVQSRESLAFDAIGPDAVERCSPIRDGLRVPGDLGKGNTVVGFNMDL